MYQRATQIILDNYGIGRIGQTSCCVKLLSRVSGFPFSLFRTKIPVKNPEKLCFWCTAVWEGYTLLRVRWVINTVSDLSHLSHFYHSVIMVTRDGRVFLFQLLQLVFCQLMHWQSFPPWETLFYHLSNHAPRTTSFIMYGALLAICYMDIWTASTFHNFKANGLRQSSNWSVLSRFHRYCTSC